MATIVKRGPYQWQAKIRKKGFPTQTKTFDTRAEAEAWASTVEADMIRGVFNAAASEAERTKLRELIERYLREVTPHKKGAQQETYRLRKWLEDPLAERIVTQIRGVDLAEWRDRRLADGRAATTVRNDLGALSHVFTVARKDWGLEDLRNPVQNIRKPPMPRGRDRRLKEGEEETLLATASPPFRQLLILAIETAMRQSELLRLRWDDVDLKSRVAKVRESKNGESREIPLSRRACQALRELPRSLTGYVFTMDKNRAQWEWRKLMAKTGIENLRFHDLRHEATSRLFEKGLNPMEVSAITGHKTLGMLKRYTHLRAADLLSKIG